MQRKWENRQLPSWTSLRPPLLQNPSIPENPWKFLGWSFITPLGMKGAGGDLLAVKVKFFSDQKARYREGTVKALTPASIYTKQKHTWAAQQQKEAESSLLLGNLPCWRNTKWGSPLWCLLSSTHWWAGQRDTFYKSNGFWYFEAIWRFLELGCKELRSSSIGTSQEDKGGSARFFKVPACPEQQALLSTCSPPGWRLLRIWEDGKEWNFSRPDPFQESLMACSLFPESIWAAVELGKNEYEGQFS